jgi:hypothetical protein
MSYQNARVSKNSFFGYMGFLFVQSPTCSFVVALCGPPGHLEFVCLGGTVDSSPNKKSGSGKSRNDAQIIKGTHQFCLEETGIFVKSKFWTLYCIGFSAPKPFR